MPAFLIWTMLFVGVLADVAGATSMKLSDGFTRLWPSLMVFAFYAAAFELQARVLQRLGLGLTYSVWAGAGTVVSAIAGMILFKEGMPPMKVVFLLLIVVGIIGARFTGSHAA